MKLKLTNIITLVVLITAAVSGGLVWKLWSKPSYSEYISVYQQPRHIKPFELIDHNQKGFTEQQLKGKWSLVFLGYLSCPDICPMTMMKLSRLIPPLQEVAKEPVQVLFVSVDPKRDNSANIKDYVNYFNPQIIGLSAEHKQLFPFVRNLGLMYSVPTAEQTTDYFVDHSASIALINPNGQIQAMLKAKMEKGQVPTIDPDSVIKDFTNLQKNSY